MKTRRKLNNKNKNKKNEDGSDKGWQCKKITEPGI